MRYIENLKEDEQVVEHYLCKKKQLLKSRSGKSYLSLLLQDKTGTIDAKVWEINNSIKNFEENDFIKIDALVTSYQGELQLKVFRIRKSVDGEYIEADYIPTTEKNVDTLYEDILKYIKSINSPYIKKLLTKIYIENEFIADEIKKHSAAKAMHHGYMGGLIEHTVSVTEICDFMSTRYKYINRDILIASALLHDIGKIYELSPFPDNDYTDEGQLLGHIVMEVELIGEVARDIPDFPKSVLTAIKHCLLAHHGEYIYGSPKRPKTIEAFILHCADNMDAKVKVFEELFDQDNTQGNWLGYNKMFERNLRKSNYNND